MIELKNHVGELNWSLFPFYALTNWVAAFRAYQLYEMNIIIRLWMVTGLIGGAFGHFMDLYQVLKVCTLGWAKQDHWGLGAESYYIFSKFSFCQNYSL